MLKPLADFIVACNCLIEILDFNRVEAAFCCAHAAFETLILIDFKRLLNLACRRFSLADAVTKRAALAFFGNNRYLLYLSVTVGRADGADGADMVALRALHVLRFINHIK